MLSHSEKLPLSLSTAFNVNMMLQRSVAAGGRGGPAALMNAHSSLLLHSKFVVVQQSQKLHNK